MWKGASPEGAKEEPVSRILSPLRGLVFDLRHSHGSRPGLSSIATPWLSDSLKPFPNFEIRPVTCYVLRVAWTIGDALRRVHPTRNTQHVQHLLFFDSKKFPGARLPKYSTHPFRLALPSGI